MHDHKGGAARPRPFLWSRPGSRVRDTEGMASPPILRLLRRDGVNLLIDTAARQRGVLVAFSDRNGGVSEAPFDSLNLAIRGGDVRERVLENRRRVANAAEFSSHDLALGRQVHGRDLIDVRAGESGVRGEADGLLTRAAGPVLSILSADCGTVVVEGEDGLAVLHAGWRGLVGGVIEAGIAALGAPARAWIGPCIRSCCYEVGSEVIDAFRSRDLPIADPSHVDIAEASVAVLRRVGVGEVAVSDACTCCDLSYFSYRRDGVTGRQGAFAARVDE